MALKHFAPFRPDDSHPFDRQKAAHLLRRAGFGATAEEIDAAVEQGLEATVAGLFKESAEEEERYQSVFQAVKGRLINFADAAQCQAWWVYRMLTTQSPLREKLTLFWHGHFATSFHKVEDLRLMHRQIETLRGQAWGYFRDLVLAVAKDPAMLVWLDGESSTKEHPNENFARELMELFTCGLGNYTEKDVQEAARAFTGWRRDGAAYRFEADDHDAGPKRFLGKSGRFDGDDVIDILVQQPATPRFVAAKLLRFFAAPEPASEVIDEAAEVFDRARLSVKWFLRELFQSRYFYSNACYRTRIASPVEYVVGTVRTLVIEIPASELVGQIANMGQELLAPPNVKGWDGERKWINSTTLAARLAFARQMSDLPGDGEFAGRLNMNRLVPAETTGAEEVVERLAALLFQGELPEKMHSQSVEFLMTNHEEGQQPAMFRENEEFRQTQIRGLLAALLSSPEYQAC